MLGARRARQLVAVVAAGLVCAVVLAFVSHAQTADDVAALNAELVRLYQAGRFAEATEIAERVLAIREKALGPEHRDVGSALNNLATLYRDQGRIAEAEPLLKRALAIIEKALGPDHPNVGLSLNNLAGLYYVQGRAAEAEPLYKRSLAIIEKAWGPSIPMSATRSTTWPRSTATRAATPRPSRSISAPLPSPRRRWGSTTPSQPIAQQPGLVYRDQARYAEAEPLLKRALAILEKGAGPPTTPKSAARSTTWPGSITTRAATPRPSRSRGAPLPSPRRR